MFCKVILLLATPGSGPVARMCPIVDIQSSKRDPAAAGTNPSRSTETVPLDATRRRVSRLEGSSSHIRSLVKQAEDNSVRAERIGPPFLLDALSRTQVHSCALWYLTAEKSLLMLGRDASVGGEPAGVRRSACQDRLAHSCIEYFTVMCTRTSERRTTQWTRELSQPVASDAEWSSVIARSCTKLVLGCIAEY